MHIVACSMSGLVAARMAASWPESFGSIMITSPILERESEFMVESFQGIKELLEESRHNLHDPPCTTSDQPLLERRISDSILATNKAKLPGEVVQGFTLRWAGSERIPHHISSYLSRTWLERLVLHPKGLGAARDWWFDLYWLRQAMPPSHLAAITCDLLVVEGDWDLPYDRKVGEEIADLFPNAKSKKAVVEGPPFLLGVKRPEELTRAICAFLGVEREREVVVVVVVASGLGTGVKERIVRGLGAEEGFELVKVYGPDLVADSEDDDADSEEEEEEEAEDEEEEEEGVDVGGDESLTQYRMKLHNLAPSPADNTTMTGGFTTTRTKRTGSSSSTGNNYFSATVYHHDAASETGDAYQGPLVKTLQETHI